MAQTTTLYRKGNVSRVKFDEARLLHLTSSAGVAPIWNHSNTLVGAESFQNAAILLLQSLCTFSTFSTAVTNDECIYDTFMSELQQMIWLIRSILESAEAIRIGRATKEFSFSIGVTTRIYFVLNKYQDRAIRRELVSLCYKYPRRDGAWDTEMDLKMLYWYLEFRFEGLRQLLLRPQRKRIVDGI